MSMHKVPLTSLEESGLKAHHLPIDTPSQLSDAFRHGAAWALMRLQQLDAVVAKKHTPEPPLTGRWHHGNGNLVCGTIRVAVEDFDTHPSEKVKTEVFDWICHALNEATKDHTLAAKVKELEVQRDRFFEENKVLREELDKALRTPLDALEQVTQERAKIEGGK